MGESDRFIEYRNKYYRGGINFNINSPVVFLIIINFSVFLFVKLFSFGKITGDTSVVPYFFEKLNTFLTGDTFKQILNRPWSIVTYSFFHFEFLTIVSNMLWLLGFGGILQSITGMVFLLPVKEIPFRFIYMGQLQEHFFLQQHKP